MNRVTAVLLAAGALLVHVLALYRGVDGVIGLPYEQSYVAFALARHLAHEGALVWNVATGAGGLESCSSPLLVLIAYGAELLGLHVLKTAQLAGIAAGLVTVAASTRFDIDRIAGVVPAILLVSCGALAIACGSGTEWALFTGCMTTAFVAQEKRRPLALTLSLALLIAARPEGVLIALALALQAALSGRRKLLIHYAPAAVVLVGLELAGATYGVRLGEVFSGDSARWSAGLAALGDFLRTTISPVLVLFPLVALVLGELSSAGRRALVLGAFWMAIAVAEGGGPFALQLAFVPALPVLFMATEQGISRALDTYRRGLEQLAWVAIAAVVAASGLASRYPGDLGPVGLDRFYDDWLAARSPHPPGHIDRLGRVALHHELVLTDELKRLGLFVRDELPAGTTVVSPWPGPIAYLSDAQVLDLYGRTNGYDGARPRPWWPSFPQAQLNEALAQEPEFVLFGVQHRGRGATAEFATALLRPEQRADVEFQATARANLRNYELVVGPSRHAPRTGEQTPVALLRLRRPETWPRLLLERDGEEVVVSATRPTAAPTLLVRVELCAHRADGSKVWIAPTGMAHPSPRVVRSTFELAPVDVEAAGEVPAPIHLGRFPVPEGTVRLSARFLLPRSAESTGERAFAAPARLEYQ